MDRLLAHTLFCRVVELGSFTAAAREARLPQPSVSRQIASLEESLTTRLLERTTRRVVPTIEGRAYYAQIEDAIRTITQAELRARGGFADLAGHVKIAVPGALGRRIVVPRVVTLLLEAPSLTIDVSVADQPVDFVGGGFDFAIRVGTQSGSSFVARELARSTQWLVASPAYLAARGTPGSFEGLRGHHVALRGPIPLPLKRLELVERLSTDEIETAFVAVLGGIGLSILPRWLVAADVRAGRLQRVLPDHDLGGVPVVATYPSAKRLRKAARQVLEALGGVVRESIGDG